MSEQWNGKHCPACGGGILMDGIKNTRYDYRGQSLEYVQAGAWCDHCDEGIVSGEEATVNEALLDDFMRRVDREEATELIRIRKKLKLSQQEAAKITGGGHNAFSRYERGVAKPLPAVMNLFRLLDRHPELLKEILAA
ncbi:MAG: type II toxin-antitoxin system MqsA family antitoxin [Desulfuromonadales bacterium]|nr:type II toxin-antitoxin system MqsA family antitoxin [Desulfuromonadales bacterium]